jgi:hypothetical protein
LDLFSRSIISSIRRSRSSLRAFSAARSSGVFFRFFIVVLRLDNRVVDLPHACPNVEQGLEHQLRRLVIRHTPMVPIAPRDRKVSFQAKADAPAPPV